MRIFSIVLGAASILAAFSVGVFAQTPSARGSALESALLQQLHPAQTTVTPGAGPQSGTTVVNPGTVFTVSMGGLQGAPPFRFDKVVCASTFQNGVLKPPSGVCNSLESAGTRFWTPGTKVYVYKIDLNRAKSELDLSLIECDTCNGVAGRSSFKARVAFQFAPGFLDSAMPEQVMASIGQVIAPDSAVASVPPPGSDGGVQYQPAQYVMPPPAPRQNVNSSVIRSGDFQFTMSECRAESTDVYCTLQVVNMSDADHDLIISGPPSSCCMIYHFQHPNPTQLIDPSGGIHVVSDLRLANNPTKDNQTLFRVLTGIKYTLMLHFENVGVDVNTINRLAVMTGEHLDGERNTTPLGVLFTNLPVSRGNSSSQPPKQSDPATNHASQKAGHAPVPSDSQAPKDSVQSSNASSNFIVAHDFRFTDMGCKAESTDVYCALQIVNSSGVDHDLIIQGPPSSCCMYFHFGVPNPTEIIDPSGGVHFVSDLRLANKPTSDNQTLFRVLSGLKYTLLLHFANIGVDINSIIRLSLIAGEHLDGENNTTLLPILFKNVPIVRGSSGVSKVPAISPLVEKRFVVATPDWRIISRGCVGAFGEIHCTLQVANLRDVKNRLDIGGGNRHAIVVDDNGNTFQSVGQFVRKADGLRVEGGGVGVALTFDPYIEASFDLIFSGVTDGVKQVSRFDPELASDDNGQVSVLPAKFPDVPVTPLPPKVAAAHFSGKVITAQQQKAQEAFELLLIGWAVSAIAGDGGGSSADQTHNDRCKIVNPFDKTKCDQTWMQWSQQQKQ